MCAGVGRSPADSLHCLNASAVEREPLAHSAFLFFTFRPGSPVLLFLQRKNKEGVVVVVIDGTELPGRKRKGKTDARLVHAWLRSSLET